MIDIKELRIGNWVLNAFGKPVKIYDIISKRNTTGYATETLSPIPLTAEILEKVGFKKKLIGEDICYLKPYKRPLDEHARHDIVLISFDAVSGGKTSIFAVAIREYYRDFQFAITSIKYVHQLQNLYFALTGQELEINL